MDNAVNRLSEALRDRSGILQRKNLEFLEMAHQVLYPVYGASGRTATSMVAYLLWECRALPIRISWPNREQDLDHLADSMVQKGIETFDELSHIVDLDGGDLGLNGGLDLRLKLAIT